MYVDKAGRWSPRPVKKVGSEQEDDLGKGGAHDPAEGRTYGVCVCLYIYNMVQSINPMTINI